jgi:branched-chain amino acid transport system permease protein
VSFDLPTLASFVVNGLTTGCIYGLAAIGLCVIFNASGIVNFAQGSFVMFGGMVACDLFGRAGFPLPAAVSLATALAGLLGWLLMQGVIRPLLTRRAPIFVLILATLALQIVLENAAMHAMGTKPLNLPEITPGVMFRVGGVTGSSQHLWIAAGTLALVGILWAFFKKTLLGKAMRACAVNREMASLLGISVERTIAIAFAISAALGAAGGILITPTQYTQFNIALPYGIKGFVAAIIGGFGNVGGALVGGLILGVLESLAVAFVSSGYKDVIVFTLLILILVVRPSGLFGSLVEE